MLKGLHMVSKRSYSVQVHRDRGKSGLSALNRTWPEAKTWIIQRAGKPQIVEPFAHHPDSTEYHIFPKFCSGCKSSRIRRIRNAFWDIGVVRL